MDLAIIDII